MARLTSLERESLLAELRRVFEAPQAEMLVNMLDRLMTYTRDGWVTREDFSELKQIVAEMSAAQRDLATAQARTEQRVEELAQAQARTEERVERLEAAVERLEAAVERLAQAQARTEERVERLEAAVERLEAAVERLAQAQARTEERVDRLEAAVERLAQAQARTEERVERLEAAVERLAQAQARTERALERLSRQVGGLSETVGGDIEDIAYIVLHDVLRRELGWEVGLLERTWQQWDGEVEEVNVFGQAHDPAQPDRVIWIVGEAKHNLTLKEVEKFGQQVKRAQAHLEGEVFPVCFCYRARPEVQARIQELGLRLVFSYGKLV